MVFCYRPLSPSALDRLQSHRYSCENSSLLDPLLQRWWQTLVRWCPLWLAPNLITLAGLLVNIAATLVLVLYSPQATDTLPRWSCIVFAVALFIYQSLDAIDGKQARRTGSSSPLGELFDHGCDSVSVLCVVVGVALLFGLGEYPPLFFTMCFVALIMFYQAHWQIYITGVMRFGYIDVTEEQCTMMLLFVISTVFGAGIWNYELGSSGYDVKLVMFWLGLIPSTIHCFGNILHCWRYQRPEDEPPLPTTEHLCTVWSPLVPVVLVMVPSCLSALCSPISSLYVAHPVWHVIVHGLVMSKITCRLVVCHMSKSRMALLDSSMLVPWLVLLCECGGLPHLLATRKFYILLTMLVLVMADWVVYWYAICDQICRHVDIFCFRLGSRHTVSTVSTSAATTTSGGSHSGDNHHARGQNGAHQSRLKSD